MSLPAANSGDAPDPVRSAPSDPPAVPAEENRPPATLYGGKWSFNMPGTPCDLPTGTATPCSQCAALRAHLTEAHNALADRIAEHSRDLDTLSNTRIERNLLASQCAALRSVLEDARPLLKAHIIAGCACDDHILGRLADALAHPPPA